MFCFFVLFCFFFFVLSSSSSVRSFVFYLYAVRHDKLILSISIFFPTSCFRQFLQGKYSKPPTIFATAEHYRSRLRHDATTVWLEDVTATSFKICLRELQNFAGVHEDISVVGICDSIFPD